MGFLVLLSFLSLFIVTARGDAGQLPPSTSADATAIPEAEFTLPFTSKVPRRESKRNALAALRGPSNTVSLDGAAFEDEYLVNITIGGQKFQVIVDTGR